MHLSQEAREALYTAGLNQEVVSLENHLFNTSHLAYLPIERILEGTVALPAADYETRPIVPHPLDTIAMVSQFMSTAGQEVKPRPGQPTPEVLALRLSLELEELAEKAVAFGLRSTFATLLTSKLEDLGCDLGYDFCYNGIKDTLIYDAVEVLDACVDQRYVQDGTVLACGLQDVFSEAFAEVQKSNMSKFPLDGEQLIATVAHYGRLGVSIKVRLQGNDDTFPATVTRISDGKVLKNACYHAASLGPILDKHTAR